MYATRLQIRSKALTSQLYNYKQLLDDGDTEK
jgi:hypothetical protein